MGHVQGQWPDINFKTSEGSFRVSELGVNNGVSLTGYGNSPFVDTELDAEQALLLMLRLAQVMGFEGSATYVALQIEVPRRIREINRLKADLEIAKDALNKSMALAGRLSTKYFNRPWNQLCEGQKDAMIDLAKAQIKLEEKGK